VIQNHHRVQMSLCRSDPEAHIGDEPGAACQDDIKLRAVVQVAAAHRACTLQLLSQYFPYAFMLALRPQVR
jgi:hypothetical protein